MKKQENKHSISIRHRIIIIFTVSIMIYAIVIGFMVFRSWRESARETTEIMAEDMNQEIIRQIDDLLNEPYQNNEVNQKLLATGIVDLSDEKEREKFFVNILQSHSDEIYSFTYGTESGEYYGARRNENGLIEIVRNNSVTGGQSWYYSVNEDLTAGALVMKTDLFDPRTRDWYISAKQSGKPTYSPIYKHFIINDLTISAGWPIYDKMGNLQGVLGTHMLLSGIDQYLTDIVNKREGYAYIVDKNTQELVGNSFGEENFVVSEDGTINRNKLSDLGLTEVQEAFEQYSLNKDKQFLYRGKDTGYYIYATEFHKEGLDWIIISSVTNDLFMDRITANIHSTVLVILIILSLTIIAYYINANNMVKPINHLEAAMEQLSSGDLTKRVSIHRNDEIGKISRMFNQMADKMYLLVNHLEENVQERTSELLKANETLERTKEDLSLILDSTAEGIFGVDTEGRCTFCNNRCIELLGYSAQEDLIGKNMHYQIHHSYPNGDHMPIEECYMMSTFLDGATVHLSNEVFWRADGTCFDVEYYSYPQRKEGKLIGAVVTFMNITERKRNEEQIQYLYTHDTLTGLMNRHCFEDTMKRLDAEINLPLSILFADLNGLKMVNDIFGHSSGDILIKQAANVLKKSCRNKDAIARVGGDEFIVIMPNTSEEEAENMANKIQDELAKEHVNNIKCSMAIGCDTKYYVYQDIERVLVNSESEMYKNKSVLRKSFVDETMHSLVLLLHEKSPGDKLHSEHVAELCERMGKELKLLQPDIKKLRDTGYLHDIGKIVLDTALLRKQDRPTDDEKQLMMQHSVIGYRILNLFDDTLNLANDVYAHHERWDGSGYPKGLKGQEIPMNARIIAITEGYDKMITKVDEQDAEAIDLLLKELQDLAGKYYDPELTRVFIDMIRRDRNE